MLLAYLDESYNKRKYWMAGLLCPEDTVRPLTAALDAVCAEAASKFPVSPESELHGYELFHGEGDWANVAPMVRARIGIYHDALRAVAQFPVEIIIRGVDIPRLRARYAYPDHPHSVVLAHLLERVDERAAHHSQQPTMVFADEVDGADHHRRNLWRFQRHATDGYRSRQLTQIVDTIYFAPSHASRLLQAADLITFLHQRRMARIGYSGPADRANDAIWANVDHLVAHHHCWLP